ncbi:hypothetical protein AWB64_02205 [Caballeronia sordidicola]|uniref:Uncharacterized protein n=1 Tax=Caballeronia sordidicola TaxID=196367 RepID=A0A158G437_CABSO|nr:hypothetical protein AWB64_02205 [Caballeronia sordidicola]
MTLSSLPGLDVLLEAVPPGIQGGEMPRTLSVKPDNSRSLFLRKENSTPEAPPIPAIIDF